MKLEKSRDEYADDELGGRNPEYDHLAKKILSYKKLLAAILHHVVSEFKTVSRKDIEEKYIIGTPEVGTVSVELGRTNKSDFARLKTRRLRRYAEQRQSRAKQPRGMSHLTYCSTQKCRTQMTSSN